MIKIDIENIFKKFAETNIDHLLSLSEGILIDSNNKILSYIFNSRFYFKIRGQN